MTWPTVVALAITAVLIIAGLIAAQPPRQHRGRADQAELEAATRSLLPEVEAAVARAIREGSTHASADVKYYEYQVRIDVSLTELP